MRTPSIAFTVRDWYDVLYTGDENDSGVGSGRRRRLLDRYGFCFSISLWNVSEIALRDSVVFSIVQTVMEFERIGWV
jgi:hypothetical protein